MHICIYDLGIILHSSFSFISENVDENENKDVNVNNNNNNDDDVDDICEFQSLWRNGEIKLRLL